MNDGLDSRRFAWVVENREPSLEEPCDREVARTADYVVLPSAGSLVPGWLLVVPRRPMLNLGCTTPSERAALMELVDDLSIRMGNFEGEIYCFEHGSAFVGSATGCGVDQAHLHVVPLLSLIHI